MPPTPAPAPAVGRGSCRDLPLESAVGSKFDFSGARMPSGRLSAGRHGREVAPTSGSVCPVPPEALLRVAGGSGCSSPGAGAFAPAAAGAAASAGGTVAVDRLLTHAAARWSCLPQELSGCYAAADHLAVIVDSRPRASDLGGPPTWESAPLDGRPRGPARAARAAAGGAGSPSERVGAE